MSKRSFFLALAGGLLVNLAFVTSSQAGSTTVTVNSTLNGLTGLGVTSVSALDVTISGVPPWSSQTVVVPVGAPFTISGNTIEITFSSAISGAFVNVFNQAFATFTFSIPGDGSNVSATSTEWVTNLGNVAGTSAVSFADPAPEPASMALLGIGMAGLFAFRRYFRRNTNV